MTCSESFEDKPGGRLVEEINVGRADHIEADVEAFSLAAAERLFHRAADDAVAPLAQAELDQFAFEAPRPVASREVRGANRGGELQILPDRQVFIEGVVLRDVTDVALERVEVVVKRLAVEQDLAAASAASWPPSTFMQRALAGAARAHHADQLAAIERKADAVERDVAVAEAMVDIDHLETANDVALFLDDPLGKIAAQELTDIDPDGVAIRQRRGRAHRRLADHDRAIGLEHFESADPLVVIAENLQQDIAAGSGRKQNVVFLEQARVVRDEIFRFRSLELKTSTHRARAAPQIEQDPARCRCGKRCGHRASLRPACRPSV